MSAGRDPHAEGMVMVVIVLICAIAMFLLAGIGVWTVLGWLT